MRLPTLARKYRFRSNTSGNNVFIGGARYCFISLPFSIVLWRGEGPLCNGDVAVWAYVVSRVVFRWAETSDKKIINETFS